MIIVLNVSLATVAMISISVSVGATTVYICMVYVLCIPTYDVVRCCRHFVRYYKPRRSHSYGGVYCDGYKSFTTNLNTEIYTKNIKT